jgi:hypothetical protein
MPTVIELNPNYNPPKAQVVPTKPEFDRTMRAVELCHMGFTRKEITIILNREAKEF